MKILLFRSWLGLAFAAGLSLACCLSVLAGGQVYVSGDVCGSSGCFGQPQVPPDATNVIAVAAGYSHLLALRGDGRVVAWGASCSNPLVPAEQPPPGLSNVVAIAAAPSQSWALKRDGHLFTWGGTCTSGWHTNIPVGLTDVSVFAAGNSACLAVRSNGTVVAWGAPRLFGAPSFESDNYLTNIPSSLTNVVSVAVGPYHALALNGDGTVTAWPDYRAIWPSYWGYVGQTDVPPGLGGVVAVAAGGRCSLALRSNGTVVAWGALGGTNIPVGLSNVVSIAASSEFWGPSHFGLAALADGSSVGWGYVGGYPVVWGAGLSNVVSVAAGSAMVGLYSAEPIIRRQPESHTVVAGDTVVFSVAATSPGPMTFQWRHDGINIAGATNATLRIVNVQSADTGNYDVVVSNANGNVISVVAVLALKTTSVEMMAAVTVQGEVGANAHVEWSNDAVNWHILTNFALPYSPFRFADWDSVGKSPRFYQVRFSP